jgi:hypothetical protein
VRRVLGCVAVLLAVLGQPAALAATQLTDNAMRNADFPDYRVGTTGNLHLVWYDANVDSGAIFFKMLNASGAGLIDDIQINTGGSGSANTRPVTAIDATNRLFVVWQNMADQEVYFMRLEPLLDDLVEATPANLATIKTVPDMRISNPSDGLPALNPAMANDGNGNLAIVWESGSGGPVEYVKVDPDGLLLNGPVLLGGNGSGNDLPDVAIDTVGNVHVVYAHAGTTQATEVYYAMLDGATGAVRIAPTLLSVDDGLRAGNATVSVDRVDNRVYVVYKQATTMAGTGSEQVYLDALDPSLDDQDGSVADPAIIRLHETPVTSTPAQYSWQVFSRIGSDRRVHAIYMDFDDTSCPSAANYTIYNAHVTYDGKLIAVDTLTDTGAALSCTPRARLAPRGNRVVWAGSTTAGNQEIFSDLFSRADAGSSGFFACSLGRADGTLRQAGELWLLLAFLLVLWRRRTCRPR